MTKITISGTPGSGKSVVAKKLCEELNLEYYDLGKIRRQMAEEHNMTLAELNELGEKEEWTDKEPDERMKKVGIEQDDFIFVGRLAYHFIPDSKKIFLKCDLDIGAERIFNDMDASRTSEKYSTPEEYVAKLKERSESDKKRYQNYYRINPFDESNYDLVIDTTNLTIEETIIKIKQSL